MSLIAFKPNPARDPDGRKLRALLGATVLAERFGALRSLAVHILAVLGIVVWLAAASPLGFPAPLKLAALVGFAVVAVAAVAALALELRWQRVQRRCLDDSDIQARGDP
jgi:hypothetical protein